MRKFFAVNILLAVLCGCSSTRQYTSQTKTSKITSLALIPPITRINQITDKSIQQYSPEISGRTAAETILQLKKIIPENITTTDYLVQDLTDTTGELSLFAEKLHTGDQINQIIIPKKMLQKMAETHQDFALGITQWGYSRTAGNFDKRSDQGNMLYFATLGSYRYRPYKSAASMAVYIIDRKHGNLAFYRKISWVEEPSERMIIKLQLDNLISKYLDAES